MRNRRWVDGEVGYMNCLFPRTQRGWTILEALVVIAILALIVSLLLPLLGKHRQSERRRQDGANVREVVGAITQSRDRSDRFLLPSDVDVDGTTVAAATPEERNTTAHLLSRLIYNGWITPETCVSPAEANTGGIAVDEDYRFTAPDAAVEPSRALWDPAFSVDFTSGQMGNTSYANLMPSNARMRLWSKNAKRVPLIASRGPEVYDVKQDGEGRYAVKACPASFTFLIHGGKSWWEGNVGYRDGSARFETSLVSQRLEYTTAEGERRRDAYFYDEPDDGVGINVMLGIFVEAGATPEEFKPVWD